MTAAVVARLSAAAALGRLRDLAAAVPAATERGLIAAGKVYLAEQLAQFDQLSAGGGEWPRLKPETIARKGSDRILVDSGALRRSLIPGQPNCVCDVVRESQGMRLRAGTTDPKAIWHQTGAGNLPVRRVIRPPSAATVQQMRAVLVDEVRRAVAQAAKR